ncbi:MAG TPA: S8 family serine peptidase [Verrucomicrobiae bacterium]
MSYRWPRKLKKILAGILFVVGVQVCAAASGANRPDYVEGDVLVHFRAGETLATATRTAALHGCKVKHHFVHLSAREGKVISLLHSSKTTAALLAELRADPAVEFAEPNYLRYVNDLRTPNDPYFSLQWSLKNTGQSINGIAGIPGADINFLKAWGLARPTTNEVVVGVIDTGLDVTHPDIVNNLWTNPGEIASNNLDDDHNGYTNDIHGYDFALNTGTLTDSGFHGTHVSGTIAATGNNGIGVIGVDFQAHIMVLKVSADGTSLSSAAIIQAIDYAITMKSRGVNIVALNASYGGGSSSITERSAMQSAGNAGIVFCVAAGNDSTNNDTTLTYPADYRLPNMIVVAATDQNDALASFSNYGATNVDIGAPGVNILSLLPVDQAGFDSSVQQSANSYSANTLEFSGATSSNGISGALYNCGLGNPSDFPAAVSNNIALIQRGTLNFSVKVANAMTAGALAAIIYNNTNGGFSGTLGSASNWIPAVSISEADGETLAMSNPIVTVFNYPDPSQIYQYLDGTSMATPHISGAVAFAAMNFPTETVAQRIQRILTNADPIVALKGKVATGARLDLARIVDTDGNGLPDWWELEYFGHLTGTDATADPDHDGENNLAEFLAGTNPTNSLSALSLNTPTLPSGNTFTLQWPSVAGRYYRLLRSTNLMTDFNMVVQTNIMATPPLNVFTDAPPADFQNVFYRLQLEP